MPDPVEAVRVLLKTYPVPLGMLKAVLQGVFYTASCLIIVCLELTLSAKPAAHAVL